MKRFKADFGAAGREPNKPPDEPSGQSIFQRWKAWLKTTKLKREMRNSKRFQEECKRLGCHRLAELEEEYREEMKRKF